MVRRHLLILLLVTVGTRGLLFISYPMGGGDDDQAYARYQIDRLLSGDLLVGNLRYHTGYPLAIAPVAAAAALFGRFDERVLLLAQTALAALIPFLIYDSLRLLRRPPREALIVALVAALDPFGLQWAHFALPNWLIALCLVAALWCAARGLASGRALAWTAAAGLLCGVAVLARVNLAPVVAVLGLSFFGLRALPWRTRLGMFAALGAVSAGVLALYTAAIHYPSTGTWSLSCYTGTNLLVSVYGKGFPLIADNGPATQRLLDLLTLKPPRAIEFTSAIYPRWSEPGSWAAPDEYAAFINQPYGQRADTLDTVWPGTLFYYLGPCATDDLLLAVHNEAVARDPLRWLASIPLDVFNMLTQRQLPGLFWPWYLPHHDALAFSGPGTLGFYRAEGDFYSGQVVWRPGVWLFSGLFDAWNRFKWLAPLAVIWALLRARCWYYAVSALLLLAFLALLSVFGNPAPRLYAPVYPLTSIVIGGLLAALLARLRPVSQSEI